ncbi:LytTR family DNA-binding domain-containing protein [Neolewinella persica]|uniref:LytTR family DNA-binding domain-containing protein n=1 Tax=Neolewinella persica TaxID=70998 RepID=UPI00036412D3|nr:LytTR family DNA-binding domain-containing protein [Neolewinella persica]
MKIPALTINLSFWAHFRLGLVIAVWLVAFLVLIGPFDGAELSLAIRARLMPPYGMIFLLAYMPMVWLQNFLHRQLGYWNLLTETIIVLGAYLICLLLTYAYYKSPVMNGTMDFGTFTASVFIPTVLILSFILLFGRWFISRKELAAVPEAFPKLLALRGDNRHDVLRLLPEQLVCVLSAQNYAEVYYLLDGELKKQLLRTTLTKLDREVPDLLRVHRSALVNPAHFVRWEGATEAVFYTVEVPVSKQYRKQLMTALAKE